jgi:hypothetical protein
VSKNTMGVVKETTKAKDEKRERENPINEH